MKQETEGVWYKGRFYPVWWGLYLHNSLEFDHGSLVEGLSRTIKAEKHDAGVVVEYEDGKDD